MSTNGEQARAREVRILTEFFDEPAIQTIEGYVERGGYAALRKAFEGQGMDPDAILAEIDASGLRGRGGAGFAMGKKGQFIPKGEQTKFLCCNADESEPGTFKDRALIQYCPHRLVEGCILASYAVGASFAFIYIRGEYVLQAEILEQAVREAYARGFVGNDILGSHYSLELVVHRGAGAYICGEESALLDSLEGKRGNPRLKPPFPAIKGLYQGPTLINNVETLSNVPLIIDRGAEWWRSRGTEKSPGTKVVSVSGNVRYPGNYEIELGIPSRDIVYGLAGGPLEGRRVKFWHPGGSSAPVLLEEHLDLAYDFDTMAQAGSMLGSGAIIVADDTIEVVPYAKRLAKFYRHESCGKCVPCREGTNWTVKMLERIEQGDATPMDLDIMGEVQQNIEGNCLCVLGDSMAMPVRSLLKHFRAEFAAVMESARFSATDLSYSHAGESLSAADVLAAEGVLP
jgi:NADH-quinone oxidoreductase subunit F